MWWLRKAVDEASAPTAVVEAWGRAKAKLGFVPNIQRLYALRPRRYLEWLAHYEDVMRGESGISPLEREMIALVVSDLNDCHYCLTSHAGYLRALSGDPTLPDRLRENANAAAPNERVRAILGFAAKVTRDAHGCTPEDLDRLRAVGLSEEDVFDVVETAAMFNFTNRLTSALGMVPNREFDAMGR
ncbi:MAG TPA: peroxidase-related enzyme [Chloroflexota bacterium]|nr:peroxidase-related enzyme [Chloroflexota bacterium]